MAGRSGKKKKAKDGAGLAYYANSVFALKGGNTREFWIYTINPGYWNQSEDLPLGDGRLVKGGGGLTGAAPDLFALKGNNTNELYRYVFAKPLARVADSGGHGDARSAAGFTSPSLSLHVPSIALADSRIDYALPAAGRFSLRLYSPTGALVAILDEGTGAAGRHSTSIGRTRLTPGVYLLRLESGGERVTRKLICE